MKGEVGVCLHSVPAWLGLLTIISAFVLNLVAVGSPNWANNRPTPFTENFVFEVDNSNLLQRQNDVTEAPTSTPPGVASELRGIVKRAAPLDSSDESPDPKTGPAKTDTFLPPEGSENVVKPEVYRTDNNDVTPHPGGSHRNTTTNASHAILTENIPPPQSVRLGVFELCKDGDCRALAGDELEGWYMALQALVSAALLLDASACVIGLVLAVCPSCCDPSCCDSLHVWAYYILVAIISSFLCGVTTQVLFAAEALQYDFLGFRLHLGWAYNAYFGVVFLHIFAAILYFCEVRRIYAERAPYMDMSDYMESKRRQRKELRASYQNMEDSEGEYNYGGR